MLGDSINIDNFNWNPVVLKKNDKTLASAIFWSNLHKKGSVWAAPKMKNFFSEITKVDHQLSKTFYFIKISYVLAEL